MFDCALRTNPIDACFLGRSSTGPGAFNADYTDNTPTPKPDFGILHLDMKFDESSWRFDTSESALCDLLRDF